MPQHLNTVRAETTYDFRFTETEVAIIHKVIADRSRLDCEEDGIDYDTEYGIYSALEDILPDDAKL